MSQKSTKLVLRTSTVVEEDTTLADSVTENEDIDTQQPKNWKTIIAKIKNDPSSFHSLMVLGVRKVNGIYQCMGVKNNRPYFKKRNVDYVIWYDGNEEIWSLTDSSALNQKDPELYGYLDSTTWDLTNVPKSRHWFLANSNGEWIEKVQMRIQKVERSGGLLSSLLTNPVYETRQAAQAAVEQSASLMSSFWGDFKKVKRQVKENTHGINNLKTNQDIVKEKQRDILGRLETLEKERNSDKYNDLLHKINQVEGQVKILRKGSKKMRQSRAYSRQPRVEQSVESLARDNKLKKASLPALRRFLKKKKRQGISIDGKNIVLSGNKNTLIDQVKQLLEESEKVREVKIDDHDGHKNNIKVDRKDFRRARERRALERQKKKENLKRSDLIRPRESADGLQRNSKKIKKHRPEEMSIENPEHHSKPSDPHPSF